MLHPSRLTTRFALGFCMLAAIIVATAYLYPAITRTDANRVLVVGDGLLDDAHDDVARRLRQRGFEVEIRRGVSACDEVLAESGAVVVATFANQHASGDCADVVVPQNSIALLGTGAEQRLACEWWDTPGSGEARPGLGQCRPDGSVVVRDGSSLTPAGSERFARAIVAALE